MSDTGPGGPPLRGEVEDDPLTSWRTVGARPVGEGGPRWSATWIVFGDEGRPGRGAAFWVGAFLVLVGLLLLVEAFVPGLSLISLAIAGVGLALAYAWLARGVVGATVPALVLIAWGLARLAVETGVVAGGGWVPAFVGVALLLAWAIGRRQGALREWALWVGGLLVVVGVVDLADVMPGILDAEVLIGLAIIAVGLWVLFVRRPRAA